MRISSALLIPCLASLLACGPTQPTIEPAPTTSEPAPPNATEPPPSEAEPPPPETEPTPPETEPTPPESEPAPEAPEACQVQLLLEADGVPGRLKNPVTLRASAKNLTDTPLELVVPDSCPGGEARFSGLEPPDGSYDYYATCNMGMCAPNRPPRRIALPPGDVVEISIADIHPNGKKPCNGPIAAGTYKLSFTLNPAENSPVLCGPEPLVLTR